MSHLSFEKEDLSVVTAYIIWATVIIMKLILINVYLWYIGI